jgi:hypothetical protein
LGVGSGFFSIYYITTEYETDLRLIFSSDAAWSLRRQQKREHCKAGSAGARQRANGLHKIYRQCAQQPCELYGNVLLDSAIKPAAIEDEKLKNTAFQAKSGSISGIGEGISEDYQTAYAQAIKQAHGELAKKATAFALGKAEGPYLFKGKHELKKRRKRIVHAHEWRSRRPIRI